ncbi:MAG: type II toxin-antitoxin system prevent-host-death family antitoxin [Ideonella sp.]|nr:type II toxin-antitoxin system prevent-host-death family antitoxin [Ideonella sp.]
MQDPKPYGLEQARAQLPRIASEAVAGYTSVITRHGKPVAVVLPVAVWEAQQQAHRPPVRVLSLRGTGRGLWPQGGGQEVSKLREEWA